MPGAKRLPAFARSQLPAWEYLSGETHTFAADEEWSATIPSEASIIEIRARGGEIYFGVNAIHASALSPGYIPEDGAEILGPLATLTSLRLFTATASTVVHLMYFVEK